MLAAIAAERLGALARYVAVFPASCGLLAILTSSGAHEAVAQGLSEPLAWGLFLWAVVLLFFVPGSATSIWGVALLGFSGITRLNHLPAVLLTGAMFLLREAAASVSRRTALPAVVVLAFVLLLPLAHNVAYGGEWLLTTRSAGIRQNLVLPPGQLLETGRDPETRERVHDQLRRIFDVGRGEEDTVLLTGLRLAQASWLVVVSVAIYRRTWYLVCVALLPRSYLGVHLFYQVNTYYPRHIIAGHLAIAVSLCLAFLGPNRSLRGSSPGAK